MCYGKIWEAFSSEIQKEDFNDWHRRSPNLMSNSPLLVAKRENDYDPVTEEILNERFRIGGACKLHLFFLAHFIVQNI